MSYLHRKQGFTLVELMVTLVVMAFVMLIGAPAFFSQIKRERVVSETYSMLNYMQSAQEVAVSSGRVVVIIPEEKGAWDGELVMAFLPESLLEQAAPITEENVRTAIISKTGVDQTDLESNLRTFISQQRIFTLPQGIVISVGNQTFTSSVGAIGNARGQYMLFYPDGVVVTNLFYLGEGAAAASMPEKVYSVVGDCAGSPYSIGIDTYNPPKKVSGDVNCRWTI